MRIGDHDASSPSGDAGRLRGAAVQPGARSRGHLGWTSEHVLTGGHDISAEHSPSRRLVVRVTESVLPTRHGTFRIVGYRAADGGELISLSTGIEDGRPHSGAPLVRLHSECLTGDALGSWRCDCGEQLDAALALIARAGEGVLVYVRGHEGRGIGLVEKLRAYRLQDQGLDTVDANLRLGHPADCRDYGQAADILRDLGIERIRLLSSNPAKEEALGALGVTVVERLGAAVPARPENARYLQTKRQRMRHDDAGTAALGSIEPAETALAEVTPVEVADGEVADRYAALTGRDEWVVAQSAQSLDGFLATRGGDGAGLSGAADHRHLHHLRGLADAVVVGAQTVVNDDPLLTVRLAAGSNPTRVLIDPHGRIPAAAQVLARPDAPTLWLTGPDVPGLPEAPSHLTQIRLGAGPWSPDELLHELSERGLRRVLVEGGGRTVSSFLTAGALDRLFLTTVPVLLGDGVPGVRVPPVARVADAPRWPVRRFALGEDSCVEITLRREPGGAQHRDRGRPGMT